MRDDIKRCSAFDLGKSFNPRLSVRDDATLYINKAKTKSFNPRLSVRDDYTLFLKPISDIQFQSTSLCERRRLYKKRFTVIGSFNPRLSVRDDAQAEKAALAER